MSRDLKKEIEGLLKKNVGNKDIREEISKLIDEFNSISVYRAQDKWCIIGHKTGYKRGHEDGLGNRPFVG